MNVFEKTLMDNALNHPTDLKITQLIAFMQKINKSDMKLGERLHYTKYIHKTLGKIIRPQYHADVEKLSTLIIQAYNTQL